MDLKKSICLMTPNQDILPKEIIYKLNDDNKTYSMDAKILGVNINGEFKDCIVHSDSVSPPNSDMYVTLRNNEKVFFDFYIDAAVQSNDTLGQIKEE